VETHVTPPRAALLVPLLLLLAACTQTVEVRSLEWRLVWSDEFSGEGLPDPAKWDYEEGFVRNQEAQFYTRARPENARVEDGLLIIEGRRERRPNPAHDPGAEGWKAQREAAEYTSASLITLGRASWRYGRIEVRARLPRGHGVWPAIWMMGTNRSEVGWPACGEIDVMEFVGKHPDRIHGTVHYPVEGGHRSNGGRLDTPAPYEDFHVYAVEWSAERIDLFFDGTLYHSFAIDEAGPGEDNPFRRPHYLLINLALGGSWGGPIDDGVLPARYAIDWVRVYERVGGR
jgi:beta-glucanase (GH16 family)